MEKAEEGGSSSSPSNKCGWLHGVGALLGLGLIGVMVWFLAAHSYPIIYVDRFDVFALKQTTNSSHYNNTIHFSIMLLSRRAKEIVVYDALNFTFYYKRNLGSYLLIGNALIDPLRQGNLHKLAFRNANFEARGITWENLTAPRIFRVELVTATRYDNRIWKTKRRPMVVGGDIRVNDKGSLVKMKRLRSSNAGSISKSRFELMGILVVLFFVHNW